MDDIFDPQVFRKCNGWKDTAGNIKFGKKHTDYLVIPPSEHLMSNAVPHKARCESCELEFNRYQTLIRVRRYRINRKQKEILRKYIDIYRASMSGEILLPQVMMEQLRKVIIEYGGSIEEITR